MEADGGAPEGVVERLLKRLRDFPGVEGELDSYGTWKDIMGHAGQSVEGLARQPERRWWINKEIIIFAGRFRSASPTELID